MESQNSTDDKYKSNLKEFIWYRFIKLFYSLNRVVRFLIIAFLIVVSFVLMRIDFFGKSLGNLSRRVVKTHIPILDPIRGNVSINIGFEVIADNRKEIGKIGGTYRSGDQITIWVASNENESFWYTVIGIDKKDIYTLRETRLYGNSRSNEEVQLILDDTEGTEWYYVIASWEKFDHNKLIKGNIKNTVQNARELSSSKGPLNFDLDLQLPSKFTVLGIKLQHTAKGK
ncbi:MAG: hypothetical protein AAFQ94_24970 [Bacteroidota bacterium]